MMFASSAMLFFACAPYPAGLRATPQGEGPEITVDWEAEPLPELPFPNDLGARTDPNSPTGLRVNISHIGVTESESKARTKLNELSGWGIYSPITVAFEAPLDLDEISMRHTEDDRVGRDQYIDDAFFLLNVDPVSEGYLEVVQLDVGHGRFPMDVPNSDRYFPNDSRADSPTMVFDTVDEDINGNGELEWEEDTDNDGVLDVPNVYPVGGDPRQDLLTWYERQTNTLILRPIKPLREETTYAMVLTERLVGEEGWPVRSPWKWVHHLRQTEALVHLDLAMPPLGITWDDVAYAWTFTTGQVTSELVEVRRGLDGEGPLAHLADEFPAGVTEAGQMHELSDVSNVYLLPIDRISSPLDELGLLGDDAAGVVVVENYNTFAQGLVGGVFETANLLADRDDDGTDSSDEWWEIDTMAGTVSAEVERVAFSCVLPKEREGVEPPFDVIVYGHGYGSSRFEFLGFAWAFTRMGFAACAMDFPGHGPSLSESDLPLVEAYLGTNGLLPFLDHLMDARYRDLDNDGWPDSGGDQWSADAFHTRDVVRQAVVDWAQMFRSLRQCGEGTMTLADGSESVSCDWDGDGAPDIGGPDVDYGLIGGSLGGINSAVAAPILPELMAVAPVVPGGGLLDTAMRTEIGGAVEAMHGRLMTPLFLGYPNKSGGLDIVQMVNSVTDMEELPVGTLANIPAGGRIRIENLVNGEVRDGLIPNNGEFRVAIAADGLDPGEKRLLVGMPPEGPEVGADYTVEDTTQLGDELIVTVYSADGSEVATFDTWPEDVTHEGVVMPAGSPLVAGSHGSGKIRGSPELRRIAMVFGAILEPGDPIAYAPLYNERPVASLGGQTSNVLVVPTPGDMIVPVNTGVAIARAAGFIDMDEIDPHYGMSVDQWLIDTWVVHGIEEHGPYTCGDGNPCLFDADDADRNTDGLNAPSDEPLRLTVETDAGVSGMRLPYASPNGAHGFGLPDPDADFDHNTYAIMQIASYFSSRGQDVAEDMCMQDASCDWIPALEGE